MQKNIFVLCVFKSCSGEKFEKVKNQMVEKQI